QTGINPENLRMAYLGYSLMIVLICSIALVKAVRKWQQGRFPQGFRLVQGLIGITILRLLVFLSTYFTWQGNPVFSPDLLALDQAASLMGLFLIFWLWAFPEPSREADPVVLVLITVTAIFVITQTLFARSLLEGFTGTFTFWQGLSILVILIGCGLIIIRKPNYWVHGLVMGGLLGLGSALSLISSDLEILHLSQLTAYPLLLLLGERFPIGDTPSPEQSDEEDLLRRRVSVDFQTLQLLHKLFNEKDPDGILYKVAQVTSYLILSDLTLVIDTPDEHGKIRIIAGYDLIREEPLQALTLESKNIPLLTNYIQRGKMLHIPASSTSRDLSHLSKMLQLTKPGHLLAAPVHVPGTNKTIGVVLFSPFSNRPWTKEDQDYLRLLSELYEAAFNYHLATQKEEPESVKNTIRDLSSKLTQISQDKQTLKEEMAVISKEHQNLLMDQDSLIAKHEQLTIRDNTLQRHLAMLVDLSKKESTEALRKYISVIEKEIQAAAKELIPSAPIDADPQEQVVEPLPEDPDSTRSANLEEAIQSCLDDTGKQIKKKKIKTKLDLPDKTPLLTMNHALFREIFSFLISNAVEDSKTEGKINIRIQVYEEDHTQHFAHIKISDQGDGYFPDEIAAVLNDHLTADQQEKLSQVMTNLYVTKNLVENEGGRMWVESKPGEGTIVSLLLAFQSDENLAEKR
ncbi:MAG: ATP-binding protein, partial [Anaerolineales bacterium]|nr:ATP-binding protein [Anaerolineales bacterium]